MTLETMYKSRYENCLVTLAVAIESHLKDCLAGCVHIDRVTARPKSPNRFLCKAGLLNEKGGAKYLDPLSQIQDQVGARIVVFYLSDVHKVSEVIESYFRPVEHKTLIPESEWEFGYMGKHYIVLTPRDVYSPQANPTDIPEFFEIQIKTLFQHAWSEANHDLGYKTQGRLLSSDEKRMLAFTAAQAWGADRSFEDLTR